MKDIKTKEIKKKDIKVFNRATAWKERIKDPVVYLNEKVKDNTTGDTNAVDYASDKLKYESNRAKDEALYLSKKGVNKTKNVIQDNKNKKVIKEKIDGIKTKDKINKVENVVANENKKVSKKITEQGKKLAINVKNKSKDVGKKLFKSSKSAINGMIVSLKSLVNILLAGGSVLMIPIIVICLIGLLITSIFGIFFSSDSSNQIRMSDCIIELNNEMDSEINSLKRKILHDEVIVESNRAPWKDILSVYAARVSNGNEEEVMTMNKEKKKILREVFWDMNTITTDLKIEKYTKRTIDSRDDFELTEGGISQRPTSAMEKYQVDIETESTTKVLHIFINRVNPNSLLDKYNFTEEQRKQYEELMKDEHNSLWSAVIYGTYGSSGEITEWKKRGKEWSNIRLGTSSKQISNAGCLVTSIAILIKKSEVPTKDIQPFNPGTFVIALNNVYGFDGANLQYGAISKVVPNFVYQGRVYLNGMTKQQKYAEIKKFYENGYYLAVEVLGATKTSQHCVAVDRVENNKVYMLDPDTYEIDMWKQYNFNKTTQFVYFKIKE